ncbi:MAG: winged helix-turn-helix domain-containing protein [Deltaproteobacteria bacterium]|nr:winged helix-turn-helix domain-containing protein [Deltaproteobacteria bacterium]
MPDLTVDDLLMPLVRLSDDTEQGLDPESALPMIAEMPDVPETELLAPDSESGLTGLAGHLVNEALSHLEDAELVCRLPGGHYRITPEGRELANAGPARISQEYLLRHYPDYQGKRRRRLDVPVLRPPHRAPLPEPDGPPDPPERGETPPRRPGWPFTRETCMYRFPERPAVTAAALAIMGRLKEASVRVLRRSILELLRDARKPSRTPVSYSLEKWLDEEPYAAVLDLAKAGCLESVVRGTYRITPTGLELFSEGRDEISRESLLRQASGVPDTCAPSAAARPPSRWTRSGPSGLRAPSPPTKPADTDPTAASGTAAVPPGTGEVSPTGTGPRPEEVVREFADSVRDGVLKRLEETILKLPRVQLESLARQIVRAFQLDGAARARQASGERGICMGNIPDSPPADENELLFRVKDDGKAGPADLDAIDSAMARAGIKIGFLFAPGGLDAGAVDRPPSRSRFIFTPDAAFTAILMYEYNVGVEVFLRVIHRMPDPAFFAGLKG